MNRSVAARVSLCISLAAGFLAEGAALLAGELPGAKAPTVSFATRHARSARLSDYRTAGPVVPRPNREIHNEVMPKKGSGASRPTSDAAVQRRFGLSQPLPQIQFEGASDQDNGAVTGNLIVPPDTEGDVGPNHYIQYINNVAVIYDKSGNIVLGPFKGNAFWAGLGGPCEFQNDGDPLVRYDRMADRWVFSQFALPNFPDGPFYQCFAVSTTSDPTGDYYQYEFKTSDTFFTDYGKLGIWPDAYYMTFNMFGPSDAFLGGAYAFDRAAMLVGDTAGMIAFDTGQEGGALPSDLDGPTPPPAGAPNYFMTFDVGPARLLQWQFHADWTTPENSTFTGPVEIPAADFIYPVCDAPRGQCVPQLDTTEKLETLQEKLMYRLAYRNFGDHESLVVNHTVGTDTGAAAVRWYEIRNPGDAPLIYQQGTYAPDANSRWMGSIAMDRNGDIALGYSKSSSSMHPAIAITGRLAGDPLGLMGGEDVWYAGTGSQINSSSRWGDYSTMSIDPTDDCTFWYTQEYYASTGGFDFKTRIGSFQFPSCMDAGLAGKLEGTVTDASGPIAGATVTVSNGATTVSDTNGHYQFLVMPIGTYDVTASKFGHLPATASGVAILKGGDTVQDFVLQVAPTVVVNGVVKDGSGQGWPLYAKIVVTGSGGFPGATVFTDPVTGYYTINLIGGIDYAMQVSAVASGYAAGGGPLSLAAGSLANAPNGLVANWNLSAVAPCTAQGYGPGAFSGPPVLTEGFDAGTLPPGWSVNTVSGVSWKVDVGRRPLRPVRRKPHGRLGPVRHPEQRLLQRLHHGRFFARDAAHGPLREVDGGDPVGQRLRRLRLRHGGQRRREHRRRRELDERLDGAAARPAGPGRPARGHDHGSGACQRAGALPLPGLLGLVVAGGRRRGRRVRVHASARRTGRRERHRRQHRPRPERRHRRQHGQRRPGHDVRDPGGSGAGRRLLHSLRGERRAVLRGGFPRARILDEGQDGHSELHDAPGLRAQCRFPRREPAAPVALSEPGRFAEPDIDRDQHGHGERQLRHQGAQRADAGTGRR